MKELLIGLLIFAIILTIAPCYAEDEEPHEQTLDDLEFAAELEPVEPATGGVPSIEEEELPPEAEGPVEAPDVAAASEEPLSCESESTAEEEFSEVEETSTVVEPDAPRSRVGLTLLIGIGIACALILLVILIMKK